MVFGSESILDYNYVSFVSVSLNRLANLCDSSNMNVLYRRAIQGIPEIKFLSLDSRSLNDFGYEQ